MSTGVCKGGLFPYDGELSRAVSTEVTSVDDVLGGMRAIQAVCVEGDGLHWFNGLYLEVTETVAAQVAAGGFADPEWMAALDVSFAGLYFAALRAWLAGESCPGPWRALFDRRDQGAVTRIQFALAGVNAHINRDLPLAVLKTGVAPLHGSARYRDYTAVNATLCTLIDRAKVELRVRLLGEVLPPVSALENTLAAFSLTAARESAWNNAEMLWALKDLPSLASRTVDAIDGMTAVIGKALLVEVA